LPQSLQLCRSRRASLSRWLSLCFWPTRVGLSPFALARFERDCEKGDCVIIPRYLDLEWIIPYYCLSSKSCLFVIEGIDFWNV
jgi:hypothetical protein